MHTVWVTCTQSGSCAHSPGHVHTVWVTCTQSGSCAHSPGHMHIVWVTCTQSDTVWVTCTQSGSRAHSLGHVHTVWVTCTQSGSHTHSPTQSGSHAHTVFIENREGLCAMQAVKTKKTDDLGRFYYYMTSSMLSFHLLYIWGSDGLEAVPGDDPDPERIRRSTSSK